MGSSTFECEEIVSAPAECDSCGEVNTRFRRWKGKGADGEPLQVSICLKCSEDSDLDLWNLFEEAEKR